MSLNNTPSSERIHISFFGCRNAGKSSLINAITSQNVSIVSDIKGTTTDPVSKSMEILPLGPVTLTDTAGLDDTGELGKLRVEKTLDILRKTDIAVVVVDSSEGKNIFDEKIISELKEKSIPYIVCYNKSDISEKKELEDNEICVSALNGKNINELKEKIAYSLKNKSNKKIISDIIEPGKICVLVVPIDKAAPKGRLILPQQMTIRELLDNGNICITVRDTELESCLDILENKISLVVTDSQAFGYVKKVVPENIPLTSFSILFMRYKGQLETAVKNVSVLNKIKNGDKILISEGCTHHRQCDDIGTVKLPNWIRKFSNCEPEFIFSSGGTFPKNIDDISLVIHCGGCMITEKEMQSRINFASSKNIPFTNYGTAIAYMNGILERALEPFGMKI